MYDIILKGGLIVDGTGGPSFYGDLAIRGDKIVRISREIDEEASQTVDVNGLAVSPGFIDIHSHSDGTFIPDSRCQSKIYQGITTEVAGQCGYSLFPSTKPINFDPEGSAKGHMSSFESPSFRAYMDKCATYDRKMATNLVLLVGHGTLRNAVMGSENRRPTDSELEAMKALLEEDLRSGAWGLSLGLGYAPGVSSAQDELNELGAVVAEHGGVVTCHLRNQAAGTPQSLEEMYAVYRYSGVQIHISHFKASGKANWGRANEFIEIVRKAQRDGIRVTCDVYPYRASSSTIIGGWPHWAVAGGKEAAVRRTYNEERSRLLEALNKRFQTPEDGDGLYVVTTYGKFPEADGKMIGQIACELGMSASEAVLEVARRSEATARCISFTMCEDDVMTMLAQDDFTIGTDGRGFSVNPDECDGKQHPRNYGTFPRFLRLMRENKVCSLETAVHRITGLCKKVMDLPARGELKAGYAADITVFSPNTVAELSTFDDPIRKNIGIEHVLVGGRFAVKDGEQTEVRNGQFLLKR